MAKLNYFSAISFSKLEGRQTILKTNFGVKMSMLEISLPGAKSGRGNSSFHNQGLAKPSWYKWLKQKLLLRCCNTKAMFIASLFKGSFSGLRQFPATENPLRIMKKKKKINLKRSFRS